MKKLDIKFKKDILTKFKTDRNTKGKLPIKNIGKPILKKKINEIIKSFPKQKKTKEKSNKNKSNKNTLKEYKFSLKNVYARLNKELIKYNFSEKENNLQKTNEIIFDRNKRIVSIFKDYLLWNETSDFIKEYYKVSDSVKLFQKMCGYYEEYTLTFPEYGPLEDILKIIKKYIKKKKIIFEKNEENEEKSILNRNYDEESLKSKKNKKDDEKIYKINKILNDKDLNEDLSKTYSHSKTCFNYSNDNFYIKENEKINNFSTIFDDFLKNDEIIGENYNYFSYPKDNNEEKKIENYFCKYKNKNENNYLKKEIKEKNIKRNFKESKNKDIQKLKLKNIYKVIKSSNNFKKINIKYITHNLNSNNTIIKSKKYNPLININDKQANNKNYSSNKQNNNINKITKINIISYKDKDPIIIKNIINPLTSRVNNLKQKSMYNSKYKNISSSLENKNILLSKSKKSKQNSNNVSNNKTAHRYLLLLNKNYNSIPINQKYSLSKYSERRNNSEDQKYLIKKNQNLKSKEKITNSNSNKRKKKFLSNNNFLSFSYIHKTFSGNKNSFNKEKRNKNKLNIKINNSKENNKIYNFKKNENPFINNNIVISKKYSSVNKNKRKNFAVNDYYFLSLTNRLNSNKKEKTNFNLILNKTSDTKHSHINNKSQNFFSSKKLNNQSWARPIYNFNKIKIRKNYNKKEKNKINSKHLKVLTDSSISRNDEIFKNNTIKLISIINIDNKIIKSLKANSKKSPLLHGKKIDKNVFKKNVKIANLKTKDIEDNNNFII